MQADHCDRSIDRKKASIDRKGFLKPAGGVHLCVIKRVIQYLNWKTKRVPISKLKNQRSPKDPKNKTNVQVQLKNQEVQRSWEQNQNVQIHKNQRTRRNQLIIAWSLPWKKTEPDQLKSKNLAAHKLLKGGFSFFTIFFFLKCYVYCSEGQPPGKAAPF